MQTFDNQILTVEKHWYPEATKILCLLQNAWGDRPLPLVFKPNKSNKSANRMRRICGKENIMHFCNTTGVVTSTASGKAKPDEDWLGKVLEEAKKYDLLIVCGKQAKEAFDKATGGRFAIPVIAMPHPASRSLTNALCDTVAGMVNVFSGKYYKEVIQTKEQGIIIKEI